MAYVPGLEHDLFLSYAHEDLAWVNALQEQLTERLLQRLGWKCDVWQDRNKVLTGQNWTSELDKAIRESAAFLAVVSRNYQGKDWCERELETFRLESEKDGGLETGGYRRVLKVIKFPWRNNEHIKFLEHHQHVEFFDVDGKTGVEREFKPTSERFRKAADMLSFHVEKLFDAMLRGREKVFVAHAAADAAEDREAVIREIRAAGYAMSPPPMGAVPRGLDRATIRQYIDETSVTVHLLGVSYDSAIREQIDLALEAEKKVIFYLLRGHESSTGEQKQFISDIRENKRNIPEGKWALLESRSRDVLRQNLIELLTPRRPTAAAVQEDASRVYLLCDPTTPEDASFAREVQVTIQGHERISVELPRTAVDSSSPSQQHERLLRECDGLLLYHRDAPPKWVKRSFADLLTVDDRPRARELKSKAILVGSPDIAYPGLELTVLQRHDPFDVSQLEPFLAPLRVQGDVANAS
jgi:hypothetical protein